jgi:protocatechuate 3,4-dioxygenase beta subunit
MKRAVAVVAISVLAILVVVALRCRGSRSSTTADPDTTHSVRSSHPRPDPARLVRGSLAGTVTDEAKHPVAGAHVCADGGSEDLSAELFRDALCVITDAHGAYTIDHLLPATYVVSAWARTYQPGVHDHVVLRAGDRATAIDLLLASGGVELTGTVVDVTGGTIAHARVSGAARHDWLATVAIATTEADDHGGFSLWVAPGRGEVNTTAEGYTDGHAWIDAPAAIEIRMTPEATLAGVVVDAATGEPVDGARVELHEDDVLWRRRDQSTLSDASGAFRFTRLVPGRFSAVARTDRGYGRSDGTSLVELGQHVEGIALRMFPAYAVEGQVAIGKAKTLCEDAYVSMIEQAHPNHWVGMENTGGLLRAEGILPGTYKLEVRCHHLPSHEVYPPVVVADRDVTGLVWPIALGGTVRGRVVTTAGAPVDGESVVIKQGRGLADAVQRSGPGGAFEFDGVAAGDYDLYTGKVTEAITVAAGAVVERELAIGVSGTIEGTVVDSDGKPIARLELLAVSTFDGGDGPVYGGGTSDQRGAFIMRSVAPGEYYVAGLFDAYDKTKPHETKVVVRADQVSTLRLVVAVKQAVIKGTVVDARARPISDAYVYAVPQPTGHFGPPERDARYPDDEPAVTGTDGRFSLPVLATGEYMLHAQRNGGGEVFLGHVVAGSTVTLQIHATGSIVGTVRSGDGGFPEELMIEVKDPTGIDRREQLFRTDGRYAIHDLPTGKYTLSVEVPAGWKSVDIELAEGETRTADLILDPLVTVTARLVDAKTHQPVVGSWIMATSASSSPQFEAFTATTDAAGRFTFLRMPFGALTIHASSSAENGYHEAEAVLVVAGAGDLGDLGILRSRSVGNDPVGELGFKCSSAPYRVLYMAPDGPAAKTTLVVGDEITSVDGTDVTGANYASYTALVTAPPGTTLAFGLARGATVNVTLAAPPPD